MAQRPQFERKDERPRHCGPEESPHSQTPTDQASEAIQLALFAVDCAPDAIFWIAEDGRFFYVNKAAGRALGYRIEELLRMTITDIAPALTLSLWLDRWRQLKASGDLVFETIHRAKDGRTFPVEVRANYVELDGRGYACAFARDISERRRTTEALQESQTLYQDLVETSQDLLWQCDQEGRYTYLNPAWAATFGYALEEMLGKPFWAFQPPDYAERDRREFSRLLRGTAVKGLETVHLDKDGREIHLVFSAKSVRDERGNIIGTRGAAYDVTERRRAEKTLQTSEARFRNIANAFPLGMHMYELGKDDRLVFIGANPAADKILGVNHAAFLGKTIEEAFPGLVGTEVPARYRDAARDGVLWHTEQVDYQQGQIRGAFDVVAFQTEPGKMTAVFSDITERKQAAEALRVSEEHYRSLFDNMLNGFAYCRMLYEGDRPVDFTYLEVNRAFESLTGLKGVTGKNVSEVIPGIREANPELFEVYGRVALTGRPERCEIFVKPLAMWFLVTVYSLRREYFVAVFDVITERKQAQEAMRRLNESLEQQVAERTEDLRRTVGRLRQMTLELSQAEDRERKRIADILHEDVQQMLAGARFHLNLLAGGTCSAEESRAIIEQVRQLLRDTIEKSRSLSHELSPAIYQVDLVEILNWLARHMEHKHGLVVRVEPHGRVDSPSEPLKAFLYKVAQELLFNVVRHAGVREARVRVRRMGSNIHLSIVDRGRGFAPRDLEKAGGFGLLSIQERVRLLGGRMKIRSMPDAGSRILISVPDQTTSANTPPAREPEAPERP